MTVNALQAPLATSSSSLETPQVTPKLASDAFSPLCVDGMTPILQEAVTVMRALQRKDLKISETTTKDSNKPVQWRSPSWLRDFGGVKYVDPNTGSISFHGCLKSDTSDYQLFIAKSGRAKEEGARRCEGSPMGDLEARTQVSDHRVDTNIRTGMGALRYQEYAAMSQAFLSWLHKAFEVGGPQVLQDLQDQLPETMRIVRDEFGLSLRVANGSGPDASLQVDYRFALNAEPDAQAAFELHSKDGALLFANLDKKTKTFTGTFVVGKGGSVLPFELDAAGQARVLRGEPVYFTRAKHLDLLAKIDAKTNITLLGVPVSTIEIDNMQVPVEFSADNETARFQSQRVEASAVKVENPLGFFNQYSTQKARNVAQEFRLGLGMQNPSRTSKSSVFEIDLHTAVPNIFIIEGFAYRKHDEIVESLLTNRTPASFEKLFQALEQDLTNAGLCDKK